MSKEEHKKILIMRPSWTSGDSDLVNTVVTKDLKSMPTISIGPVEMPTLDMKEDDDATSSDTSKSYSEETYEKRKSDAVPVHKVPSHNPAITAI